MLHINYLKTSVRHNSRDTIIPDLLVRLTFVIALCCGQAVLAKDSPSLSGAVELKWKPVKPITLLVPSNPGGGWDQTGRFMQRAISEHNLSPVSIEVVNRGGAGGTIALAELVEAYNGDSHRLMITGFGMVGSALMHGSEYSLSSVTPIARLTGEFQVIAVSADSPYQTLELLMDVFKKTPESISWAGGSAGGSDQIFIVQVAEALGIPSEKVNYVAFTGGGEANAALMGNQVTAGITGFGEIKSIVESGRVKLLAVSSDSRIVDAELPTFKEKGIDVTFQNWRGIVAPPGITPAQKSYYQGLFVEAQKSELWQQTLRRNEWQDSFMIDPEFKAFLDANKSKTQVTLASMGIGKSQDISAIGPYFFPKLIGLGLLLASLGIVIPAFNSRKFTKNASSAEAQANAQHLWKGFGLTALIFIIYIVALSQIGFLISTPIFIVAMAYVIGSRQLVRDIIFAIIMTGAIYVIFEKLLQVSVP